MTRLLMIRHAATPWNRDRRIQGLSDIPIDEDARNEAAHWRVPNEFAQARWYASPLIRAVETAQLLGGEPATDDRLIEMNWGLWEGDTLDNLRATLGDEMTRNEDQGLDFRPPEGESPRDIQERVLPWLADIAATGHTSVAVTHKGVIRAVMALATGWNMMGKAPARVLNGAGHIFDLSPHGTPTVGQLNVSLLPETEEN